MSVLSTKAVCPQHALPHHILELASQRFASQRTRQVHERQLVQSLQPQCIHSCVRKPDVQAHTQFDSAVHDTARSSCGMTQNLATCWRLLCSDCRTDLHVLPMQRLHGTLAWTRIGRTQHSWRLVLVCPPRHRCRRRIKCVTFIALPRRLARAKSAPFGLQ